MNCRDVQRILGIYVEGAASPAEEALVREHLSTCPLCATQAQLYQKSWEMLGEWTPKPPQEGYVSRFWTKVAQRTPWYQQIWEHWKALLANRILVLKLSTLGVVLVLGSAVYLNSIRPVIELAQMSPDEIEMAANMDFVQYVDLLDSAPDIGEADNVPQNKLKTSNG